MSGTGRIYPGALTQSRHEYQKRLREVAAGAPHCKSRARKATCVLPPGHGGSWHEGNGFDEWGPKYAVWRSKPSTPKARRTAVEKARSGYLKALARLEADDVAPTGGAE